MNVRNRAGRATVAAALALLLATGLLGLPAPAQAAGAPQLITTTVLSGANPWVVATAQCPFGKQLHGGGAAILNGGGNVTITELVPSLTTKSLTAVGYENDPTGGVWAVEAHAVCADPTPNLTVVTNDSPFNQDPTKSATAVCPPGQKTYGLGWEQTGDLGNVLLQQAEPAAGLNSVTVTASANGGWAGWWELRAYAICGDDTGGMSRIELQTVTNSSTSKWAQMSCPGAAQVYGVGGEHTAGGDVVLHRLAPAGAALGAARTAAHENGAYAGTWSVTMYAICL
jgi:hypothetical protein